jgi:hypothetical protein
LTSRLAAAFAGIFGLYLLGQSCAAPFAVTEEAETGAPSRVFTGDYETGDFRQWNNCQALHINSSCDEVDSSHHSMQIVTSPVRQGIYAARFEVRDGDIPAFGGGERAEVADKAAGGVEAEEMWYQWSTQFTANFPLAGWGAVVSQWHDASSNSPPLSFAVVDSTHWGLVKDGAAVLWKAPQSPGTWQDIKIRIVWSSDPSVGVVELWHNGVRQSFSGGECSGTTCHTSTIGAGGIYFKQGYYRDTTHTAPGVIYHDGFTAARTETGLGAL